MIGLDYASIVILALFLLDNCLQIFAYRMLYIKSSIWEMLVTILCLVFKVCQLQNDLSDDKKILLSNPFTSDFFIRLVHIVLVITKVRIAIFRVTIFTFYQNYNEQIDKIELHMTQDRVLGILQ